MKIPLLWEMTQCGFGYRYQCFRCTGYLHLLGTPRRVSAGKNLVLLGEGQDRHSRRPLGVVSGCINGICGK